VLAEEGEGWHGGGLPMAACGFVVDRVW
jgi:hypothetical protein